MGISSARHIYCIGIKGAGVSALAQLLAARGVRVSGSDTAAYYVTQDALDRAGIPYVEGFATANVPMDADLVVCSTAYSADHVEVAEALRRGLRVVTYPEAVAEIFNAGKGIAVCGTHGKTTTTAMLGLILAEAGCDPTVIVGGVVPQFGGSMRAGASDIVILEADEYEDKLAQYQPYGVVLTSIEYDHPDFFPTPDAYVAAFRRFVAKIPENGFLIISEESEATRSVAAAARCRNTLLSPFRTKMRKLLVAGEHNQWNAAAAIAAAVRCGVLEDEAARTVATFTGTKRRFEVITAASPLSSRASESESRDPGALVQGHHLDTIIVDDYAHHPGEIRATISAARERYPGRRLLVAFQPHTYTRTIALRDDFARAFGEVAGVFVMDIFGSAREQHGGITSDDLAADITAQGVTARASGGVGETVTALAAAAEPGDVVLCLGAGENDRVARGFAAVLSERTTAPR